MEKPYNKRINHAIDFYATSNWEPQLSIVDIKTVETRVSRYTLTVTIYFNLLLLRLV